MRPTWAPVTASPGDCRARVLGPYGKLYLSHFGLSSLVVAGAPATCQSDGPSGYGHLESSVCTGISVSGINRKYSLAIRFLSPPPFFFNKPCYILKGFYQKCAHLFSQPRGTFLYVASDVPFLGEGEVGGARQGVLHGGQKPLGPRCHSAADDEKWLLLPLSLREGSLWDRPRGAGPLRRWRWAGTAPGLTPPHAGEGRGGGRWREEVAGTPPLPWGQPRGQPPRSHARAGRKWRTIGENKAGSPGLAVLAVPLGTSLHRCIPLGSLSWWRWTPGTASYPQAWLPMPPLRGFVSEGLAAIWQLLEQVSPYRNIHHLALPWGFQGPSPQDTALGERQHMAFLLLVKPVETPRPRCLSLPARSL